MANFSIIDKNEKIKVLQLVKKEIEEELYKYLSKLGHDPDTYALSSWSFNASSSKPDEDPEYHTKNALTVAIARLETVNAKIVQLS
ncbi:MAG: hypothetical protein RLZZ196_1862 [Bacteroidota bacterium]|jgi:hypothetical protein